MSFLDFESREKSLQVGDDQLLQPHEARGSVAAFRGGHRHQLGKRVGYLYSGEAFLAARILDHDGKIQAQVGDMRERPARVKGERLSLIHISEPTRQAEISYAVFCLK